MLKKYKVTVNETYTKSYEILAESEENAESIIDDKISYGEIDPSEDSEKYSRDYCTEIIPTNPVYIFYVNANAKMVDFLNKWDLSSEGDEYHDLLTLIAEGENILCEINKDYRDLLTTNKNFEVESELIIKHIDLIEKIKMYVKE